MAYPTYLQKLLHALRLLPGVGKRTAERFAFQLLTLPKEQTQHLGSLICYLQDRLKTCSSCGALIDEQGCSFCTSSKRDTKMMCIIANPKDLFSIEQTQEYRGLYHVLPSLISPLDGEELDEENFNLLKERLQTHQTEELILALDSTLEGDATALYIQQQLKSSSIGLSRLAFGLPMGSSLDYVDENTLTRSLHGRQHLNKAPI